MSTISHWTYICDDCGASVQNPDIPLGWFPLVVGFEDRDMILRRLACSHGCAERLAARMVRELIEKYVLGSPGKP